MIKYFCSRCGQKIAVPDDSVGEKVKCPKCGKSSPVPTTYVQGLKSVIKLFCYQCGQKLRLSQDFIGEKCKGPKCQTVNTVRWGTAARQRLRQRVSLQARLRLAFRNARVKTT